MGTLDGKVAIVTGGGKGVGRGIALALSKEGAAVVVVGRNADVCLQTANDIKGFGARALSLTCDVRRRGQVEAMVESTVKEFGTVDILVNNAQDLRYEVLFEDTTDDDMALALESGLLGTFYCMQTCFPYLKERGGKIINLASGAGTEGAPGFAAYAAVKEGIRALTRVASHEWGKHKINVNVICPLANSSRLQGWGEAFPEQLDALLTKVSMGRLGDCEKDIGRAVVFLASSDSDYITGQTLMVDGGQAVLR